MNSLVLFVLLQVALNLLPQIYSQNDTQFIIYEANATWNEAKEQCSKINGHLLRIDSSDKWRLLLELDGTSPWSKSLERGEFWIGLHSRENVNCSEVHHFWESGCRPLGWSMWGAGFPDNCQNNRCVVMKDMRWYTANCSDKHGFICEEEIDCQYTGDYNKTLKDVSITQLVFKEAMSTCDQLCKGVARGDTQGCSTYPDNGTCLLLFVDSGHYDYPLRDSYKGTEYFFKSCERSYKETINPVENNENELPQTECPSVLYSDYYYEYLDAYRVAIIPSLYQTLDLLGDVETCKDVCMRADLNGKQCWAVNMFSVLSNFCRLYYLNSEPSYLFYERYVTSKPGPLFLRRRLVKHEIHDDGIVDTIEELEVDHKNTTLYKMKFLSVFEDKISKIGMGVVGSIFIATSIIAVIVSDCRTICRHVRTIGARNIRKRTICKGKKKNKKLSNKVTQAPSAETGNCLSEVRTTPSKGAFDTDTLSTPKQTEMKACSSKQKDTV